MQPHKKSCALKKKQLCQPCDKNAKLCGEKMLFFAYIPLASLKNWSKYTFRPEKVYSKWVCLEVSWVDFECFDHCFWRFRWLLSGFFSYSFKNFWLILRHFWPHPWLYKAILGLFWNRNGSFCGNFGPFLGQFGAIFRSRWIISASFWHHFGVVLVSCWPHFGMLEAFTTRFAAGLTHKDVFLMERNDLIPPWLVRTFQRHFLQEKVSIRVNVRVLGL